MDKIVVILRIKQNAPGAKIAQFFPYFKISTCIHVMTKRSGMGSNKGQGIPSLTVQWFRQKDWIPGTNLN